MYIQYQLLKQWEKEWTGETNWGEKKREEKISIYPFFLEYLLMYVCKTVSIIFLMTDCIKQQVLLHV